MKINWGLIGLGNISKIFAEAFQNTKNSNLLAIASKNEQKLHSFKNEYLISRDFCFDDYEKLIKCDKVDVVYISLPNSFHKEWIDKFDNKEFIDPNLHESVVSQLKDLNSLTLYLNFVYLALPTFERLDNHRYSL